MKYFIWITRIIPTIILLQTLYFKFSAAPEAVYIFTKLGMEPWGRLGIGVLELVTGVLLLIPKTSVYGAVLGVGLMLGAIYFHLTKLGISVMGDRGQLFAYAVTVLIFCLIRIFQEKNTLVSIAKSFLK